MELCEENLTANRAREAAKKVFDVYREFGGDNYIGELVNQTEHAIQSAMLAEQDGATNLVILGTFLHDIGHIVGVHCGQPMITDSRNIGVMHHENVGAEFLSALGVPESIVSLVRDHVKAKRYLTFKDPTYYARMSTTSKLTLEHQGGPMTSSEADKFVSEANFENVLKLRKWDEVAKVPNMKMDDLSKYETMLQDVLMNSNI